MAVGCGGVCATDGTRSAIARGRVASGPLQLPGGPEPVWLLRDGPLTWLGWVRTNLENSTESDRPAAGLRQQAAVDTSVAPDEGR